MPMGMMMWAKKVVPYLIVAADGSGDFTDIQAAHDALPDTGGQIHVKAGTYTLTTYVTISKDNVSIFGDGRATKIVTAANTLMFYNAGDGDWMKIRSIWFYGAGAGNNNNSAIVVLGAGINFEVKDCIMENCGRHGILVGAGSKCIIKDNYVIGAGFSGIILTDFTEGYIIDNTVYDCVENGIQIGTSDDNFISGNFCHDNDVDNTGTYSGIIVLTSNNNILVNNRCKDNDKYEIEIQGAAAADNMVIGNICVGTDHAGTIVDTGTRTIIAHNVTA